MEGKHIFAELGIIADLQMLVDKKWSVIEPIIHTFSFKKHLGEEIYNNIFDNVLNINRILNYQDAIIFFESVIRIFLKQNRNDYFKKVIFVSNLIKSKINFEGTFLFRPESPRSILNIFFNNYDSRRTLFDVKFLTEHIKPDDIGSSMINAFIEDLCKTKSYNVSVEKCEIVRAYKLNQILDLSYYLLRSYFPTPECIYYRHPEVDKLIEYGYFSILEELEIRKNEKLSMEMGQNINSMTYAQVTRRIELLNELNFKLHSSDFSLYIKNVTRHNDVYKYVLYINFRDTFFFFDDEDFEILKRIKDANLDLTWDLSNGIIAAALDYEVAEAMAESGCIGLFIGMESGNKEILRSIKKPGTVKNFLKAAEILKEFPQIDARGFLIIGFPQETFSQIRDTFEVAREMALDWWNIQILQPLPNTPIFDMMVKQGLINPDDFEGVRFTSGQHGKSKVLGGNKDLMAGDFKSAFDVKNENEVPKASDLNVIWPYMIFHLNYGKFLKPMSNEKLLIGYNWLNHLTTRVVPGDAFAQYFKLVAGKALGITTDNAPTIAILDDLLGEKFWQQRFADFNLDFEQLKKNL